MGLYVKGVLGSFQGKVGAVIGSNWRSIDYMRSLPRPSKRAATEKQQAHREKFALVMNFLAPLRDLIDISYRDSIHEKQTAFNKAMSHVMSIVEGDYPNFSIPYEKVILAKGRLWPVRPKIQSGLDNLELQWRDEAGTINANSDDVVNIVMYNESTDDFYVFQDAVRSDGSYLIDFDEVDVESMHTWVFATSADGSLCSKTHYLGLMGV